MASVATAPSWNVADDVPDVVDAEEVDDAVDVIDADCIDDVDDAADVDVTVILLDVESVLLDLVRVRVRVEEDEEEDA